MTKSFNRDVMVSIWIDNYTCWYCNQSGADALHHIIPRSDPDCSTSPLNSAPLHNYPCHINNHGKITNKDWKSKFLKRTIKYLLRTEYKLTQEDKSFIFRNKMLYFNDE